MPLLPEQITPLNTAPVGEVRKVANTQIAQARRAWDQAQKESNQLGWYEQVPLGGYHFERWKPYLEAIQAAEKAVWQGDKSSDEKEKRSLYLSAYVKAYETAESVAKEAKLPPTNFTTIWKANVTPALDKALDELGKQAEKVLTPIEQLGRAVVVAGIAWAIYKRLSK